MNTSNRRSDEKPSPQIFCLGGACYNHKYTVREKAILGTSNPATGQHNFGGVARNVAENLLRLGASVGMWSALGDDANGHAVLQQLRALGCDVSALAVEPDRSTAVYQAILEADHNLLIGIADMDIFESLTPQRLQQAWPGISGSQILFADCNLPAETLAWLVAQRKTSGFKLAVDTVSIAKTRRLPSDLSGLDILFTNIDEGQSLLGANSGREPAKLAGALVARGIGHVVLTDGARGLTIADATGTVHFAGLEAELVDASGAGDGLIAGTLWHLLSDATFNEAVKQGILVATLTVESRQDVRPDLSPQLLAQHAHRTKNGRLERE